MIAFVRGVLDSKEPARAVVDVNGVGYDLLISFSTYEDLPEEGAKVRLLTIPQIRDDKIQLFGFSERSELDLFRLVLNVPGVGPKLALAIFSTLRPGRFRQAVRQEDTALLSRVPGIGKKSAQRIVVELKSRFEKSDDGMDDLPVPAGGIAEEAVLALEALGFRSEQAGRAVGKAIEKGGDSTLEELVREALGCV